MGQSKVKPGATSSVVQSGVHRRASRAGSLVVYPDPSLERPSYDVDPRDPDVVEVAAALVGTLRATRSRGLSASQLGHHDRVFCIDATGHPETRSCAGLVVLANPTLLFIAGSRIFREECCSFPQVAAEVARASRVVVAGTVPGSGREVVIEADGFEARCLLHELDHLDGIAMVDRVTSRAHVRGR